MADGEQQVNLVDRLTAITAPRAQNVIVILRTNIQEVYGLIIKSNLVMRRDSSPFNFRKFSL